MLTEFYRTEREGSAGSRGSFDTGSGGETRRELIDGSTRTGGVAGGGSVVADEDVNLARRGVDDRSADDAHAFSQAAACAGDGAGCGEHRKELGA
jgi:hypothetical protein